MRTWTVIVVFICQLPLLKFKPSCRWNAFCSPQCTIFYKAAVRHPVRRLSIHDIIKQIIFCNNNITGPLKRQIFDILSWSILIGQKEQNNKKRDVGNIFDIRRTNENYEEGIPPTFVAGYHSIVIGGYRP